VSRAAYCLNRADRKDKPSPYKKAWGHEFEWGSNEHTFGARCLYKVHAHEREKYESVSNVGIWVGYNMDSNQHLVVPLEAWDPIEQEYLLGNLRSVGTVRVFEDQFPLRCIPLGKGSPDLMEFNNFVDRIDPLYQHAPVKGDSLIKPLLEESAESEYEIKSIIGTKHRGKAKRGCHS